MNSVNCVNCQAPRTEKHHKVERHLGNVAVTAGGLYGTAKLFKGGNRAAMNMLHNEIVVSEATGKIFNHSTKSQKIVQSIVKAFENLGEKIFKGKAGRQIEEYARKGYGSYGENILNKSIKSYKGRWAMGITAGLTALALITRGIYKAGKINGEQ